MAESELPKFDSLDKLVEFFDTHDLGEYWEAMPEADFDIDISSRIHVIALDDDLAAKLTEIAKKKQVSSRTLINTWLREKVSEQTKTH